MRGLASLALAVLVPLASASPVWATVAPPPLPGDQTAQYLSTFAPRPQSVRCGDREVRVIDGGSIAPKTWQQWKPPVPPVGSPGAAAPQPVAAQEPVEVYGFAIDADGAVIDLRRQRGFARWGGDDQAAAIATWRFAPGAPAQGCSVDLGVTSTPLSEASPANVIAALAAEGRSAHLSLRKAAYRGGDCDKAPVRRPHVMVYPDLRPFDDKFVDAPWAGIRYDIDGAGATRNVTIVSQTGEAAFADTAAAAVADSRYQPGTPRTGCVVTFKARPRTTPAPKLAGLETLKRPGDACDVKTLNLPENKAYPPGYSNRRVAGWAYLRFDVAPWGQIGNIEVVAAQPAEVFGQFARNLVNSAKPTAPATGYRGCVVPVSFAIPAPVEDDF